MSDFQNSPDHPIFEEIRGQIIAARTELGITQKELSLRSGLTQANISRIEQGVNHPTIDSLLKIADGLGKGISFSLLDPQDAPDARAPHR